MCKTIEIRYACGHPHSYALIEGCHAGFFPDGILCGRQNTEIIDAVTLLEYPYCTDYCFNRMVLDLEIDHLDRSAKLMEDAHSVGWTEADISGSLVDLGEKFEREINDLREVCSAPEHKHK